MPGTKAQYSVVINAKPEDVFTYVSDLSKHGEWADNPLEITAVDDSEIAVGKRYKSTAEFRGRTVTGEQSITAVTTQAPMRQVEPPPGEPG